MASVALISWGKTQNEQLLVIRQSAYRIDKVVSLFEFLSKFVIVLNGALVLAALEPVALDNWSDLSLELPTNVRSS